MKHVRTRVDPTGMKWCPKEQRGRCMEHSVHAAIRALVETVAPTPIHLVKRTLAQQARGEAEDDDDDDDDLDVIGLDNNNNNNNGDGDGDNNFDFDPKDLLGKVLAFVNQVRSSPQARKYFQRLCMEENLAPLQLLKWVRTTWVSLYDLITRLLAVRPACTKFTLLADSSPDVQVSD